MICVDFNHKSRSGMPFEGLTPNELSECDFNCVNARWEKFFREKKDILSALAFGDEDLVDIGLLAVRGHLCRFPDCPDSWLIRRAKLDMLSARKWGQSLDAPKRERKRQNPEKDSDPTREGRDFDRLEYQAYLYCGRNPETVVIDRLQYEAFWRDLSEMERQLVAILKEEVADRPRYFNGRYVPVERKKGKAKSVSALQSARR